MLVKIDLTSSCPVVEQRRILKSVFTGQDLSGDEFILDYNAVGTRPQIEHEHEGASLDVYRFPHPYKESRYVYFSVTVSGSNLYIAAGTSFDTEISANITAHWPEIPELTSVTPTHLLSASNAGLSSLYIRMTPNGVDIHKASASRSTGSVTVYVYDPVSDLVGDARNPNIFIVKNLSVPTAAEGLEVVHRSNTVPVTYSIGSTSGRVPVTQGRDLSSTIVTQLDYSCYAEDGSITSNMLYEYMFRSYYSERALYPNAYFGKASVMEVGIHQLEGRDVLVIPSTHTNHPYITVLEDV